MAIFTSPTSFRLANAAVAGRDSIASITSRSSFSDIAFGALTRRTNDHDSHPALGHLILLVFEAVMEVVCVSLPGYIVARQGMFDADKQKFVANLNVALFTPCLIFTKLASQLTADKLAELAVIPVIFIVQTFVSYVVSIAVSRAFGFGKRPANFVTAMGVFGNSNSLPISLVISLSQTLKGLHWDKIPGDNDDEVAARGILYLLIFQQLGQLVRWSWGYHVLLAPLDSYGPESEAEEGRYRDEPELIPGLNVDDDDDDEGRGRKVGKDNGGSKIASSSTTSFDSGGRTPITNIHYAGSVDSEDEDNYLVTNNKSNGIHTTSNGAGLRNSGNLTSFPHIRSPNAEEQELPNGIRGWIPLVRLHTKRTVSAAGYKIEEASHRAFYALPPFLQRIVTAFNSAVSRFFNAAWEFMNPPLWAMLFAIIVASIPSLQRLFFEDGSFIANSVTRAVSQSGGVAVPLILVVLGANLARNTLPPEVQEGDPNSEEVQIGTKLLVASLISRMLLPTIIMAPLLAIVAKYVPVSIVDDPIFVIVCFLLTGAPSALQLAQICQINGVYEPVMSKLLFQSYVIWILPSTLILVMCALEVVEWANA
ncbi:auxin efflux carrier [Xylogone sp. PMI_703]|nr:auxin efflux carrier [Xylogone sp. PMI_703]